MGWLIICSVLFVILSVYIFMNNEYDPVQNVIATFIVIAIIGGLVQIIAYNIIEKEKYSFNPLYIQSAFIESNWSVSGGFIVGTGGFSGGSYTDYIIYGEFNQGLKRVNLYANKTYIQENSSIKPQIKNYWQIKTYEPWSHWLWFGRRKRETWISETEYLRHDLILIVPENTVFKEFDLK